MRPIETSSSRSSAPTSFNSTSRKQRKKHKSFLSENSNNGGLLALDRPLVLSLAALLIVYYLVAFVTYSKVSMTEEMTSSSSTGTLRNLGNTATNGSTSNTGSDSATSTNNSKTLTADSAAKNNNHAHKSADTRLDAFDKTGSPQAIQVLQQIFPIHATEMEEIPHPGYYSLSIKPKDWPSDLPTNMQVPKFFEDSHGWVYGGSIRQYLGNGQTLPTPQQALQIGSTTITASSSSSDHREHPLKLETIYCSVASYRDPECTGTVEDLYERAKYPERIRVAILDQRVPKSDDPVCAAVPMDCATPPDDDSRTLCKYGHLIDRIEVDARYSVGPVFARHLAHRFYRGEYFAMQIDSHGMY